MITSVWRALEKDFREIPDAFGDLRADWSHQPEFPNQWRLAGSLTPMCRKRFEAVATIAGKRLLPFSGTGSTLPLGTAGTADPLTLWLTAVRERTGQFEIGPYGLLQDETGRTIGHLLTGTIRRVIEASALLCLQLAGEGISLERPVTISESAPHEETVAALSSQFRFQIALSFPGEARQRVQRIAELLSGSVPKAAVLYDKWLSAELARPGLDVYLTSLYKSHSLLLVFFLCGDYAKKEWCGLEWRIGRDLIKQKQEHRLMTLRLDDAEILSDDRPS
jgi:hypothetical protein